MAVNEKTRKQSRIMNYLDESYQEVRKVSWPTRNQAVRLTFLVLGFCLAAAIFIGAFDFIFFSGYKALTQYANTVVPAAATADPVNVTTGAEQPITAGGVEATTASGQPVNVTTVPVSSTAGSVSGQPITVTTEPVTPAGTTPAATAPKTSN